MCMGIIQRLRWMARGGTPTPANSPSTRTPAPGNIAPASIAPASIEGSSTTTIVGGDVIKAGIAPANPRKLKAATVTSMLNAAAETDVSNSSSEAENDAAADAVHDMLHTLCCSVTSYKGIRQTPVR
ncbi:TPA: hypothetical protein ACH3X1_001558 [Trebouxia sp. C0004]